jgi:hypothetical protein
VGIDLLGIINDVKLETEQPNASGQIGLEEGQHGAAEAD